MTVLAIDPGFARSGKGCALALSADRVIVQVGYARPPKPSCILCVTLVDVVVWERPQLDDRSWDKVQTLVELAVQGASVAAWYAGRYEAELVDRTPTAWKGSEPKPQAHARMWRVLTDHERKRLGGDATWREIDAACERGALERWKRPGVEYYPRRWAQHNILDACQLNLTYTGRMT